MRTSKGLQPDTVVPFSSMPGVPYYVAQHLDADGAFLENVFGIDEQAVCALRRMVEPWKAYRAAFFEFYRKAHPERFGPDDDYATGKWGFCREDGEPCDGPRKTPGRRCTCVTCDHLQRVVVVGLQTMGL